MNAYIQNQSSLFVFEPIIVTSDFLRCLRPRATNQSLIQFTSEHSLNIIPKQRSCDMLSNHHEWTAKQFILFSLVYQGPQLLVYSDWCTATGVQQSFFNTCLSSLDFSNWPITILLRKTLKKFRVIFSIFWTAVYNAIALKSVHISSESLEVMVIFLEDVKMAHKLVDIKLLFTSSYFRNHFNFCFCF